MSELLTTPNRLRATLLRGAGIGLAACVAAGCNTVGGGAAPSEAKSGTCRSDPVEEFYESDDRLSRQPDGSYGPPQTLHKAMKLDVSALESGVALSMSWRPGTEKRPTTAPPLEVTDQLRSGGVIARVLGEDATFNAVVIAPAGSPYCDTVPPVTFEHPDLNNGGSYEALYDRGGTNPWPQQR